VRCTGTVVERKGEVARVAMESSACGECHACGFGAVSEGKGIEIDALNEIGAENGDEVFLEVSGQKVMSASAILFLIPFAGFIAGFLIGYYPVWYLLNTARTLVSVILAFAFLAASYYPVHLLGARSEFEFVVKGIEAKKKPGVGPEP
jgi:sigma-E factor negative regulatory protein RseC